MTNEPVNSTKNTCTQHNNFTVNIGNKKKLEMLVIPAGSFLMGTSQEEATTYIQELYRHAHELRRFRPEFTPQEWAGYEQPVHKVEIPTFYLSKYEITQAQWKAVMGYNPSHFKGDDLPVEQVSWHQAVEFCRKLSEQTGNQYRLPSEAEWEYAARANTQTPFAFGHKLDIELANYAYQYPDVFSTRVYSEPKGTTEVGIFPPNAFGLCDMHGNVLEWCQDIWHPNYLGAPTNGSAWEQDGNPNKRAFRGGCYGSYAFHCRSSVRENWDVNVRNNFTGFRIAMSINTRTPSNKIKQTISFSSDQTWLVFDQNQDPRENGKPLGYAQPVKLNDHFPPFAPKNAFSYDYKPYGGWQNLISMPHAYWIWAPGITNYIPNADLQGYFFAKKFELFDVPTRAKFFIAADDFAEIIINNRYVGTIGSITNIQLAAQAQQEHSFDITHHLIKGNNTFIIRAKNGPSSFGGRNQPCSYSENPAGIVFGVFIEF